MQAPIGKHTLLQSGQSKSSTVPLYGRVVCSIAPGLHLHMQLCLLHLHEQDGTGGMARGGKGKGGEGEKEDGAEVGRGIKAVLKAPRGTCQSYERCSFRSSTPTRLPTMARYASRASLPGWEPQQ